MSSTMRSLIPLAAMLAGAALAMALIAAVAGRLDAGEPPAPQARATAATPGR